MIKNIRLIETILKFWNLGIIRKNLYFKIKSNYIIDVLEKIYINFALALYNQ